MQADELNMVVKHLSGSRAYGMDTEDSDWDYRGVFCADRVNIQTPFFPFKQTKDESEEDTEYWELTHYLNSYVTKANPNMIESLWVDFEDISYSHDAYKYLRGFREELLSKKVAFTYSGYACSQLKRIKGHNKWIQNPQPVEPPRHIDYLSLVKDFSKDEGVKREGIVTYLPFVGIVHYGGNIFGALSRGGGKSLTNTGDFNINIKQNQDFVSDELPICIFKYNEQEYNNAKISHKNYWEWKNNRNIKRSLLEEKYGYDCKHASHLVRLLRQGEEILKGHGVIVKRPDAKELLEIRNGAWEYNDLVKWAGVMDNYITKDLYNKSTLRKSPDIKLAAAVLVNAQEMMWSL